MRGAFAIRPAGDPGAVTAGESATRVTSMTGRPQRCHGQFLSVTRCQGMSARRSSQAIPVARSIAGQNSSGMPRECQFDNCCGFAPINSASFDAPPALIHACSNMTRRVHETCKSSQQLVLGVLHSPCMKVWEHVKQEVERRGHKRAAAWLGEKCGYSAQQMTNWAGKRDIPPKEFATIAAVLGVSIEWIASASGRAPRDDELHPLKAREELRTYGTSVQAGSTYEPFPDHTGPRRSSGKVDLVVMDVRASMGHGIEQPSHENVVMSMVVDETWLRRHANFSNPDNLGILTGIGDSMQPTFEDGDPLLVDRAVNDVRLDAIYVLSLNDRLYIKRLQQRPDGAFVMISDNKSYESYVITDAEREKFQVLGRVVMVWNARKI